MKNLKTQKELINESKKAFEDVTLENPIPLRDIVDGIKNGSIEIDLKLPSSYPKKYAESRLESQKERIISNLEGRIKRVEGELNTKGISDSDRKYYERELTVSYLPHRLRDSYQEPITGEEVQISLISPTKATLLQYIGGWSDMKLYEVEVPDIWERVLKCDVEITNGFICIGGDNIRNSKIEDTFDPIKSKKGFDFHYSYIGAVNSINYFKEKLGIFFVARSLHGASGIYKNGDVYTLADRHPYDDDRMTEKEVKDEWGVMIKEVGIYVDPDHSIVVCDLSFVKDENKKHYTKIPVENGTYEVQYSKDGLSDREYIDVELIIRKK